jgi:hypothetical protein
LNYSYIPDFDLGLRDFLIQNPAADLHEIRRAHPSLRSISLDHLALRIERLERGRDAASLK